MHGVDERWQFNCERVDDSIRQEGAERDRGKDANEHPRRPTLVAPGRQISRYAQQQQDLRQRNDSAYLKVEEACHIPLPCPNLRHECTPRSDVSLMPCNH